MAVHVRYNSWHISLPSTAKQQREMTKFCLVSRAGTITANFYIFIPNLSLYPRFSFVIVLTVINKVNGSRVSRDAWVKYKFIF